jgi:hypothetical protein
VKGTGAKRVRLIERIWHYQSPRRASMPNRRDELVSGGAQIDKLISGVAVEHAGLCRQ